MNDDRDSYLCHLPGRTPVTGVPLKIFARSADGYSEWFDGQYDGIHWRADEVPAEPSWYVRGWREVTALGDGAVVDCRQLVGEPSADDPLLLGADGRR